MEFKKSTWTLKGIAALLGFVDQARTTGTLREFYDHLWNLFYENKKMEQPTRIEDPIESLIWHIHELGRRSREKDEEALAQLFIINTAASLQLNGVSNAQPDFVKEYAERCDAWFGPVSSVPTIDGSIKETIDRLNLGNGIKTQKTKRTELRARPTGFAFLMLTYMSLVRFGFLKNQNKEWQSKCSTLPPLSKETVKMWWSIGGEELERSFPTLHIILSSGRTAENQLIKDRALQRVEQAFIKLWKWFAFVSVYSLASNLIKKIKPNLP